MPNMIWDIARTREDSVEYVDLLFSGWEPYAVVDMGDYTMHYFRRQVPSNLQKA